MSEGMGAKIDEMYDRITGETGIPEAAGVFYKIPNSGKLADLSISIGKDLSNVTSDNFLVEYKSFSTSTNAPGGSISCSRSGSGTGSVSYDKTTTEYSISGLGCSIESYGHTFATTNVNVALYVHF